MSIHPAEGETSLFASAKINLALHITGVRSDGYHLLDSLVCFADIGDRISVVEDTTGKDIQLDIQGPFADGLNELSQSDNLVLKAANLFALEAKSQNIQIPGLRLNLEKHLPIASGIGGGSADAAAVLSLLQKRFCPDGSINLHNLAIKLGADVPMCLDNRPKHVKGIGDIIDPVQLSRSLPIVMINPGLGLSTPQVFGSLVTKQNPAIPDFELKDNLETIIRTIADMRNDLQSPAISFVPEISEVLKQLEAQSGCGLARMSGSGATCFGLFHSSQQATDAMIRIKEKYPTWWVKSGNSIPSGS